MTNSTKVTLESGRVVEIRRPKAGECLTVKIIDILQMDPAAHAVFLDRCSDITAAEFKDLYMDDAMSLMMAGAVFFQPKEEALPDYPSASKTRGK